MNKTAAFTMSLLLVILSGCSGGASRGVADKRSNFQKFLPMEKDPNSYGLKPVKPYFQKPDRTALIQAFRKACTPGKEGSSIFDEGTNRGYYVNCDPRNPQILNGYVPVNPRVEPHSH